MGAQNQRQKWRHPNAPPPAPPTREQQYHSIAARQLRESVASRAGFDLREIEAASWKGVKLSPGTAEFLQCWCPGCSTGSNNRLTITTRPPGGGGPVRYLGCYFPIPFDRQGMDSPEASPWELDANELNNLLGRLLDVPMENGQSWAQTRQPLLSTSSSPGVRIPEYYPNVNVNSTAKGNNTRLVIPSEYSKYYPGIYPHANANGNSIQDSNLEKENRQSWAQTGEQLLLTPSHRSVYLPQRLRVRFPAHNYGTPKYQAQFANFDYTSPEESDQDKNGTGDDEPTEPFPAYVESPERLDGHLKKIEKENGNNTNTQQHTWAEVLRMNNNTSSSNSGTNSNMEPDEQNMQAHASRFGAWGMNSSSIRQPLPAHLYQSLLGCLEGDGIQRSVACEDMIEEKESSLEPSPG